MKTLKILFFSLVIQLVAAGAFAQSMSCCTPKAKTVVDAAVTDVSFYASADFAALHPAPEPFNYELKNGKFVTFSTSDGTSGRGLLIKANRPTNRYLLVFHEWWGLNSYIEQEAERWQKELGRVNVLVVDLFDGNVAETAEQAQALTTNAKPERMVAIIQGAIKYAGPKAKIATLGWCFGGGWALQASLLAGRQTTATVMYYGMPELDVAKLKSLSGPVIEFFGSKDQYINQEKKQQFVTAMHKAGKKLETHTYDAVHAFANPSNPDFNKSASIDSHRKALAFLEEYFIEIETRL